VITTQSLRDSGEDILNVFRLGAQPGDVPPLVQVDFVAVFDDVLPRLLASASASLQVILLKWAQAAAKSGLACEGSV